MSDPQALTLTHSGNDHYYQGDFTKTCDLCGLPINEHTFIILTETMTRDEYRKRFEMKPEQIERFAADSTSIKTIGYNDPTCVIEFTNGHLFAYTMTPGEFEAFALAESKGRYYAQHIKGKISGTKLTGACAQCQAAPQVIGETCACGGKVVGMVSKREAERLER